MRGIKVFGTLLFVFVMVTPTLTLAEGWNPLEKISESLNKVGQSLKGADQNEKSEPAQPAEAQQTQQPVARADDRQHQAQDIDQKELIRQIQTLLASRGFDPGGVDGVSGKKTRDAICHYQSNRGLKVNPLPSVELLRQLRQPRQPSMNTEYTGISQHQCDIAHLNNLNNIQAVEAHGYEGSLTPDDRMCTQVVVPFNLETNMKHIISGFTSNLINLVKRKDQELQLEELKLKAKKANWMPLDAELYYGKSIHEQRMEKTRKVLNRDSKRRYVRELYERGDASLERVLATLGEEHPYQFRLFLVDDRSVNAEAIPGGYLYVNSGVFKTDYADLVIAHEIAHVLRRHTTKELQARLVDSVETVEDLKKLASSDSKDMEMFLEKLLLLQGAIVQYSKQQELQSDACAVRIALRAENPDLPKQIASYIADIEEDHVEISKKASSHPAYPERKERMISVYAEVKEG